jgi:hypothetical protein
MRMVELVDDTMGAAPLNRKMYFSPNDLAWWQEITKRSALSNKEYPDVVEFCLKGSDVVFRARLDHFYKVTK